MNRSSQKRQIVLHANTSWYLYRFYSEMIDSLVACNYKVVIVVPEENYKLSRENVAVEIIKMNRSGINPFVEILYIYRLFLLFRTLRPDVILNFTVKCNIYGGICSRVFGTKCINTVSGIGSSLIKQDLVFYVVRYLYKLASSRSINVFLNIADMQMFQRIGIYSRLDVVIPGAGINVDKFHRASKQIHDNSFLYLGRLIGDKGINEFLAAAEILHSKGCKFLIAGDVDVGNPTSIDSRIVSKLVSDGVVNNLGFIEDVTSLLEKVDCLVLPSYSEGLSRVMLEAASMEVGLIATDVPGCREVVSKDGGLLVVPKSIDSLVSQIELYSKFTDERKQSMKKVSRMHVAGEFSVQTVIAKYKDLL